MKSYLSCLTAIVTFAAAPAFAMPSLQFVDNLDSSVTLQIATPSTGSLAAEVSVMIDASPGLSITGVSIADPAVFDPPNPGANPLTGGTTFGLYLDELASGNLFASYGSAVVSPGAYDFLNIEFEGEGTLSASGLVAALGVNHTGLTASIDVVPEPTTAMLGVIALLGVSTRRRGVWRSR